LQQEQQQQQQSNRKNQPNGIFFYKNRNDLKIIRWITWRMSNKGENF